MNKYNIRNEKLRDADARVLDGDFTTSSNTIYFSLVSKSAIK